MTQTSLIDELSQVRMTIKELRRHEAELIRILSIDARHGHKSGENETVDLNETRKNEITSLKNIKHDRRYLRSKRMQQLDCIQNRETHDISHPSALFKEHVIAVARRWSI